jgi:hypothetical protein
MTRAIADRSQRRLSRIAKGLFDLLLFSTSARADSQRRWLPFLRQPKSSNAMDDPYGLMLAMFGVAVAAVMLVAGELYLVTRPAPPEINSKPPSVVTSSVEHQPR